MNKASAKYYLWVLLPVFLFCSCNKYSHYPKWILGEWIPEGGMGTGYYFNDYPHDVRNKWTLFRDKKSGKKVL